MSDTKSVKGSEFLRKVQALGKANGREVTYVPQRGKGSHGTLYYGDQSTVVRNPKDELKTGTFNAMLNQLGIDKRDL